MKSHVVRATGSHLRTALTILYSALPTEERAKRIADVESLAATGELDLSHLLLAEHDGQPVGVLMMSIQDSGVGTLWPPVVLPHLADAKSVADLLLEKAAWWLDRRNSWIGQILLLPEQVQERQLFERHGFCVLTELIFFECDLSANPGASIQPARPNRLVSTPYRGSYRLRFASLLEQTYRGTLDCPELNGIRSPSQSLQQLEASGEVIPKLWRSYQLDRDAVGLLLSVNRTEIQAREVVYLGVVEHARRRGIGREMLTDSLRMASQDGVRRLLIAADIRNDPACRLYESLGFTETDHKVACVRWNPSTRSNT